jgi:hypothetical protein
MDKEKEKTLMNDKEKQTAAAEDAKPPAANFAGAEGHTIECVEDEEDGEFLAQSGDEPNYRIIGGEMESITRPDEQIHKAGRLYFEKLWYYRCYLDQVDQFERGLIPCVNDKAEAAAEKLRQEFGREELEGPYTDFEWGMINGKLSALRWVSGEEWDSLDT